MYDIQRLPAILFNNHNLSLEDIHSKNYEILKNKQLHDISDQTKYLNGETLKKHPNNFREIISASYKGKKITEKG